MVCLLIDHGNGMIVGFTTYDTVISRGVIDPVKRVTLLNCSQTNIVAIKKHDCSCVIKGANVVGTVSSSIASLDAKGKL